MELLDLKTRPEEHLYTTTEDMVAVHEALSSIGRFTFAATFGKCPRSLQTGCRKITP